MTLQTNSISDYVDIISECVANAFHMTFLNSKYLNKDVEILKDIQAVNHGSNKAETNWMPLVAGSGSIFNITQTAKLNMYVSFVRNRTLIETITSDAKRQFFIYDILGYTSETYNDFSNPTFTNNYLKLGLKNPGWNSDFSMIESVGSDKNVVITEKSILQQITNKYIETFDETKANYKMNNIKKSFNVGSEIVSSNAVIIYGDATNSIININQHNAATLGIISNMEEFSSQLKNKPITPKIPDSDPDPEVPDPDPDSKVQSESIRTNLKILITIILCSLLIGTLIILIISKTKESKSINIDNIKNPEPSNVFVTNLS